MKIIITCLALLLAVTNVSAQSDTTIITGEAAAKLTADITRKVIDTARFLSQSGNEACGCIDSISVVDKDAKEMSKDISDCIDKQVGGYQLAIQLYRSMISEGKYNELQVASKGSRVYTDYYRRIERWLMDSCKAIGAIAAGNNKESVMSVSQNENARAAYTRGVEQMLKENYKEARDYFKTAVALDEQFAFAWDNLGLCHRKLGNLDDALAAYNKSLTIDPKGKLPLQNIAIVYEYKKDYGKALEAYKNILNYYPDDPEAWYGEGRIYTFYNTDWEKALDAMCKAYNIYTKTSSPYRVDAEKNIQYIYGQMKEAGKEKQFNKILKQNNISTD